MSPEVVAAGSSVVVVLKSAIVVLLHGTDKHQEEALATAAKYDAHLDGVYGLSQGRDVAIFTRKSNLTPSDDTPSQLA